MCANLNNLVVMWTVRSAVVTQHMNDKDRQTK